ncbi:MAG: M28 family peptidase [Planctomycetota bacterium]
MPTQHDAREHKKFRIRFLTRSGAIRIATLLGSLAILGAVIYAQCINMPGESHRGLLPPATDAQTQLARALRADVEMLAGEFAERHTFNQPVMTRSSEWLESRLRGIGYETVEHVFVPDTDAPNLIVEVRGTSQPNEVVLVGAHFDSELHTPGADDNASGVAGVLALAQHFHDRPQARTLRFACFVNEEPPHFMQPTMGSLVYAKTCADRGDRITAMIAFEMLGYFDDAPGSQQYPPPLSSFYPSTGDFIAFVGDLGSRDLVREAIASFRTHAQFPSEGVALPESIEGIGWSDHWAFWQAGYPAIMVTDTAHFRNPHYHRSSDTPGTLDYDRMSRVVEGMIRVVEDLAR